MKAVASNLTLERPPGASQVESSSFSSYLTSEADRLGVRQTHARSKQSKQSFSRSGSEPDSRAGCPVASTLATESLGSGKNKFLNSPKQVRLFFGTGEAARPESFAMRTLVYFLFPQRFCRPGRDRNFQLSSSCRETTGLPIVLVLPPRLPSGDEGLKIFIEPSPRRGHTQPAATNVGFCCLSDAGRYPGLACRGGTRSYGKKKFNFSNAGDKT